jgi:hypothetical protein
MHSFIRFFIHSNIIDFYTTDSSASAVDCEVKKNGQFSGGLKNAGGVSKSHGYRAVQTSE